MHQPQYHNPFPQLSRVAVLPFYNQSADPTIDQDQVALAYYNELQAIRGFEVVPVGVTKARLQALRFEPRFPEDFQRLAQLLDVDAVVVGSVTEYSPYYPPRMGISVRWYAANPSFHPIPPGYGLPWGTADEEAIPSDLVFEAEFALAKEQLATQTPDLPPENSGERAAEEGRKDGGVVPAVAKQGSPSNGSAESTRSGLPTEWPDPRGFVPPPPSPERPSPSPQSAPVMTHTRLYHGNDTDFTQKLANYYVFRDDARFGDWPGYLQRSEDFIRFCCHLHIAEMLAARGGAGESRVVWRWPIRRYER